MASRIAKIATITSAISRRVAAIRAWEAAYENQQCTHEEHLSHDDAEEHAARLKLVLDVEPQKGVIGRPGDLREPERPAQVCRSRGWAGQCFPFLINAGDRLVST
ncbi:MAG TPA: hypothetical protein VMT53_00930 [Terriglobales bacterium]|nr:hypothetical protein [Terriglobales bacterium]